MEEHIYTVSEISREIKRVVEQFISPVWVEGEVSNYSYSRAGHIYFSLKDQYANLNCIVWRNVAISLPFQISDGMRLIVHGNITTYPLQSQYQINIFEIRAAGVGTLYQAFEALKRKLSEEGLFDETRKIPIPRFPSRVGIVTSPTGAAIQDILKISGRRNPSVEIVIFPAQVQGEGAADTICRGIEAFNELNNVDFIIIGRGGGSIEDLWAFNEEKVARTVAESRLPIVSAVGHETDFTLSDFAADLRAPTPSAAVEMTIQELSEIRAEINRLIQTIRHRVASGIESFKSTLKEKRDRLIRNRPLEMIHQRWQRLDEIERRVANAIAQIINSKRFKLESIIKTLKALDPKAILTRGFAIVYLLPERSVVKSVNVMEKGDSVSVELSDGYFNADVSSVEKNKQW